MIIVNMHLNQEKKQRVKTFKNYNNRFFGKCGGKGLNKASMVKSLAAISQSRSSGGKFMRKN